jgi:hypothetical protein
MQGTEIVRRAVMPGDRLSPGTTPLGEQPADAELWDTPPPYFEPATVREKLSRSSHASEVNNTEPFVLNELCGHWETGDFNTWRLIAAMCALGLFIALAAYALPHGQDAYVPPIKVY